MLLKGLFVWLAAKMKTVLLEDGTPLTILRLNTAGGVSGHKVFFELTGGEDKVYKPRKHQNYTERWE